MSYLDSKSVFFFLIGFLVTTSVQADLVLVSDFEGANPLTLTGGSTLVADPTDPTNQVLSFSSTAGGIGSLNLSGMQIIANNTVGTFFFQAFIPGDNRDVSIGLSEQDQSNSFGNLSTQVLFVDGNSGGSSPTHVSVRDGDGAGGGTSSIEIADPTEGAWYSFWMVVDEANATYDLYIDGPGFAGQTMVVNDYGFRRSNNPGNLDEILLLEGGAGAGNILFDNFYIDNTGVNLANPIPEPSTLCLISLAAGIGFLRVRKKKPSDATECNS